MYYGTSDILSPWLINPDELEKLDMDIFDYCELQDKEYTKRHTIDGKIDFNGYPKENPNEIIDDIEDVEIYIQYGGGEVILGQASKSKGGRRSYKRFQKQIIS